MLPSSASTTSNLAVTGVSGTVENRPARQVKLRNTRDQARIGAVFAFPLQWGTINLGVLDLYRRAPGSLSAAQVRDAISAADAAALMLLGRRTGPDPDGDVGWDRSWSKRAEIHQATGMVVAQLGIRARSKIT